MNALRGVVVWLRAFSTMMLVIAKALTFIIYYQLLFSWRRITWRIEFALHTRSLPPQLSKALRSRYAVLLAEIPGPLDLLKYMLKSGKPSKSSRRYIQERGLV